ncbi:MAG: hypothetical protein DRO23_12145 [Thermoprotei archaeon]|nr:MAG: hypothetical protein DRO23_12145 [Thermoprotei archaeon]
MGKVVYIYAYEPTGGTVEADFSSIYVDGAAVTAGYYKIPKGKKLKIAEVDVASLQDTIGFITLSKDVGTTTPTWQNIKAVTGGRSWRFPLIIGAVDADYGIKFRYIQSTPAPCYMAVHGEIEDLE